MTKSITHNMTAPLWTRRATLFMTPTILLAGCIPFGGNSRNYHRVTRLEVHKEARRLDAFSGSSKVRSFRVNLGKSPKGHKYREGDGRTPVGNYVIDRKNPESQFYLSLGISYPNKHDKRIAEALGVSPGGDIFIHGQPNNTKRMRHGDWTEGCIAVSNNDMRILYRSVSVGTPIRIYN